MNYQENAQRLHALNLYYFEAMLMLILILWLIKWLLACQRVPVSVQEHQS